MQFKKLKLHKRINCHETKGSSAGFTLVELLVAISLFSVVMLVSVAAILSIVGGNKKAQQMNAVVNNLNFSIESMVRDMKTGYVFRCGIDVYNNITAFEPNPDILSGCDDTSTNAVSFISTLTGTGVFVGYRFDDTEGKIYKIDASGTEYALTSNEIDLKSVKFYVNSPEPGDGQPSIFLVLSGTAKLGGTESDLRLQTFISQRILNLDK